MAAATRTQLTNYEQARIAMMRFGMGPKGSPRYSAARRASPRGSEMRCGVIMEYAEIGRMCAVGLPMRFAARMAGQSGIVAMARSAAISAMLAS